MTLRFLRADYFQAREGELQACQYSGGVFMLSDVVHQLNRNFGQGLSDDYTRERGSRPLNCNR